MFQEHNFPAAKWHFYPKVVVAGENWDAANEEAVKAGRKENTFLVHPFDQVRLLREQEFVSHTKTTGNHMGGSLNPSGRGECSLFTPSNYYLLQGE